MSTHKKVDLNFEIGETAKYLERVRDHCLAHRETIAVAESVTSGLVQAFFSQAKDAMSFFQGGITVYNCAQKTRHLDIEPIYAEDCNGVSADIAAQLALKVSAKFCSQVGIGITGYASPIPEEGILDLYAWLAIAHRGKVISKSRIKPASVDSATAQMQYAFAVIKKLAAVLR